MLEKDRFLENLKKILIILFILFVTKEAITSEIKSEINFSFTPNKFAIFFLSLWFITPLTLNLLRLKNNDFWAELEPVFTIDQFFNTYSCIVAFTHHLEYVENLRSLEGSNLSKARSKPIWPSCNKSLNGNP